MGPTQWVPAFFTRLKLPVRAVNLSPSSVEVKNEWRYTSSPLYVFVAWASTNFILTRNETHAEVLFWNKSKLMLCHVHTSNVRLTAAGMYVAAVGSHEWDLKLDHPT